MVDDRLEALAESEELSAGSAMIGILRFVLQKMAEEPEKVSVREAADVLAALAKANAGESVSIDEELSKWIQQLS